MTCFGLVDTGSDHVVFPKSIVHELGISIDRSTASNVSVFGGARVTLMEAEAVLRVEVEGEACEWTTLINVFDFDEAQEEIALLGHAGFLEFFTATFDGQNALLTLVANDDRPAAGA